MLPEFPSGSSALCTCTDFARRGLGSCKHIVAADRWFRANPEAPAGGKEIESPRRLSEVWREIDRRLADLDSARRADVRKITRPGAALYEPESGDRDPRTDA